MTQLMIIADLYFFDKVFIKIGKNIGVAEFGYDLGDWGDEGIG
jgi:hypothetical protein